MTIVLKALSVLQCNSYHHQRARLALCLQFCSSIVSVLFNRENIALQRRVKLFVRGLVKFVPALAYSYCAGTNFTKPRTNNFTRLCTFQISLSHSPLPLICESVK